MNNRALTSSALVLALIAFLMGFNVMGFGFLVIAGLSRIRISKNTRSIDT